MAEKDRKDVIALYNDSDSTMDEFIDAAVRLIEAARAEGPVDELPLITDPKYDFENGRLVNITTRVPIPDDEPIMIFRAKDMRAPGTIAFYMGQCFDFKHKLKVLERLNEFMQFAKEHMDRMKEPDSDY